MKVEAYSTRHVALILEFIVYIIFYFTIFGCGNGSPLATNVVVLVVVGTCCYQIFNVLKLLHFAADRNLTSATDW